MNSNSAYLAFDLGAESGRAVIGRYGSGVLSTDEIHRFANEPVLYNGELHWDVARLWLEIQKGLALAGSNSETKLDGVGVDTWGLDYALLGENGALLENPFQYRDSRTDGMVEKVCAVVPAAEIYERTGIQFMQINALYQLYAAYQKTPKLFQAVEKLVTIPDLFNFWLTGKAVCEFTNATTTQFYDPRRRCWAAELLDKLCLPTHMLTEVIQPGTVLGPLRQEVGRPAGIIESPVIAPACHDTGSAVAAIESAGESVYISSGTWSLLGTEIPEPIINPEARQLNFTNEGGVCGTIRLLKNIMGLWLLQCCRREWRSRAQELSYAELAEMARTKPAFRSLVDPDHASFLRSGQVTDTIAQFCRKTQQPVPDDPYAFTRAVLESLALKYRLVLEQLEQLTGRMFREIHIVGGGAKNRVLNQFTAEATGRRVVAGPIEATALGNLGMQMLAVGAVSSIAEARRIIARSFPTEIFEPREHDQWQEVYARFRSYCDLTRSHD
jgi:rhamnulokinase